jgi:hypothetical protein
MDLPVLQKLDKIVSLLTELKEHLMPTRRPIPHGSSAYDDAMSYQPAPEGLPGLPAHGTGQDAQPLKAKATNPSPPPPPMDPAAKSHPDLPPEHANFPEQH